MAFVFSEDKKKTGMTVKEIEMCIGGVVPEKKVCRRVPTGVTESAIFIVDLEAVHYKELTVDDNGFYGAPSSPSEHFEVFLDGQGKVRAMTKIFKPETESSCEVLTAYDYFVIRRYYSWSSDDKNFRRMVAKVEHEGKFLRLAIIQYK